MTPIQLRPPTMDDLVFEGRNKSYGAFELRRTYPQHLRRALAIAVSLFLLLVVTPLLVEKLRPVPANTKAKPTVVDIQPERITLPPIEPVKPAAELSPPALPKPQRMAVLATRVKADVLVPPQPTAKVEITDEVLIGSQEIDVPGSSAVDIASTDAKPGGKGGTTAPPAASAPFVYVEVMPEFEGGAAALTNYLQKHLHYPAMALREQIEGKVFVAFTVAATGEITDVMVIKGLGYGTDEEATRVIKNMPAWTPGRQNNQPVAVRYTLPITFKMGR